MSHAGHTAVASTTRRIAAGTTSRQHSAASRLATPARPGGMRNKLVILALLGVVAAGLHWSLRSRPDPLAAFPHTFVAGQTHDPATVIVIMAPLSEPPAAHDGLGPAWQCDDPTFADAQGRPWIFPGTANARGELAPPTDARSGKAPDPQRCHRYQTAEGERLLADFRTRNPR